MTTLQPKTTLSYSFCFWFLLRCHVYCCWCTSIFSLSLFISVSFFVLFCFWKKPRLFTYHLLTKVCYKTFLTVLEAWSQQHARQKKILKKIFLHIQSDCPPPRLLHPPKGNKTFLCLHMPHILTKGGGLKTKSEALVLYVCNRALGTLEVT